MTSSPRLLLDTHVWLHYQAMDSLLRPSTEKVIDEAAEENAVFISVISIWEIAMLDRAGKIQLTSNVEDWCKDALANPGISLLAFSTSIAIESVHLPLPMHKDPADRILVASARVERMTLVTSDKAILAFAKATGLACIRA